jgi:hypothetical protein
MTTIPAPSRAVVAPPSSSSRGLDEAVDRVRESAGRTPFVAPLLLAFLAGTLYSSATAQQVTERQTAFESLADSNVPRAAVYGEPLRVVCQSGWQEEETES